MYVTVPGKLRTAIHNWCYESWGLDWGVCLAGTPQGLAPVTLHLGLLIPSLWAGKLGTAISGGKGEKHTLGGSPPSITPGSFSQKLKEKGP